MSTDTIMRTLVKKHIEMEEKKDVEGVLSTLVENPVYEFHPARLKLEGKENIREFYQEHFEAFFPLLHSNTLINECWDNHSACMEYDVYLKPPLNPNRAYRISVVLTEKDGLLIGERFYVEEELAKLMAGKTFNKFVKF